MTNFCLLNNYVGFCLITMRGSSVFFLTILNISVNSWILPGADLEVRIGEQFTCQRLVISGMESEVGKGRKPVCVASISRSVLGTPGTQSCWAFWAWYRTFFGKVPFKEQINSSEATQIPACHWQWATCRDIDHSTLCPVQWVGWASPACRSIESSQPGAHSRKLSVCRDSAYRKHMGRAPRASATTYLWVPSCTFVSIF